jgi:hypothetical protein
VNKQKKLENELKILGEYLLFFELWGFCFGFGESLEERYY